MNHRLAWVAVVVVGLACCAAPARQNGGDKPPAPDSVPVLLKKIKGADRETRLQALMDLADHGPKAAAAVPALVQLLHDQDEDFRLNAALALGRIGNAAIPALVEALADQDMDVRYHALSALGWAGPAARPAAPVVIKMFAQKDAGLRRKAAEALGRITPDGALEVLILAFGDTDPEVRGAAAEAAAKFGARAVPALTEALREKSPLRHHQALAALGHLGADARDAVGALREVLLGKRPGDAEATAATLAKIGKAAVPALADGVKDERPEVRAAAIAGLQTVGADGCCPACSTPWTTNTRTCAARRCGR
jgi:HEAT repeat protein